MAARLNCGDKVGKCGHETSDFLFESGACLRRFGQIAAACEHLQSQCRGDGGWRAEVIDACVSNVLSQAQ
jgi:hypothetical protein